MEDTKRLADAEARDRAALFGKFRNLESDLERLREKLEAENEAKADIQKQMSRAIAEAQVRLVLLNLGEGMILCIEKLFVFHSLNFTALNISCILDLAFQVFFGSASSYRGLRKC